LVAVPDGFAPALFGKVLFVPAVDGVPPADGGLGDEAAPAAGGLLLPFAAVFAPAAALVDGLAASELAVVELAVAGLAVIDGLALNGTAVAPAGLAAGFAEPALVAASLVAASVLFTLGSRWARISAART
jgi:hypothetical protein